MIVDSHHDLDVFFWCFLCGIIIGLTYDFFRAVRRNVKTGKNMLAFQDAVFCAIAFALFSKTVEYTNDGDLRWYLFVAVSFAIGMYCLWVSRFITYFLEKAIGLFIVVVTKVVMVCRKLMLFLMKPMFIACGNVRTSVLKTNKRLRQYLTKKSFKKN